MELKLTAITFLASIGSVWFRSTHTHNSFISHFRQQLFVSDLPGDSPLEVNEGITRFRLWLLSGASPPSTHLVEGDLNATLDLSTLSMRAEGVGGVAYYTHKVQSLNDRSDLTHPSRSSYSPIPFSLPPPVLRLAAQVFDCCALDSLITPQSPPQASGAMIGEKVGVDRCLFSINVILEFACVMSLVLIIEGFDRLERFTTFAPPETPPRPLTSLASERPAQTVQQPNRLVHLSHKEHLKAMRTRALWISGLYLFNPLTIIFPLTLVPPSLKHVFPLLATAIATITSLNSLVRILLSSGFMGFGLYMMPFTPVVLVIPAAHLCFVASQFGPTSKVGGPITTLPPPPSQLQSPAASKKKGEGKASCSPSPSVTSESTQLSPECHCPQCVLPITIEIKKSLILISLYSLVVFCVWAGLHAATDYMMMSRRWDYLISSATDYLTVADTRPNLGVFWYVIQLVFDRFRSMFLVYFHGHILLHVTAVYFRFFHSPVTYCIIAIGVILVFQPYPSALSFPLLLCLLAIRWSTVERQKSFVLLATLGSFPLVMIPVMVILWLRRDTGNPNFVYFMQTVHHVAEGILLVEWAKTSCNELNKVGKQLTACNVTDLQETMRAKKQK
eukprot:GHVN01090822.1.p1 GENE.GHVN01090822.1~~GHVN01090822.1.p1  ORF type:complete len:616 (+),score=90.27 GHVN01090822.1:288-2135(+)